MNYQTNEQTLFKKVRNGDKLSINFSSPVKSLKYESERDAFPKGLDDIYVGIQWSSDDSLWYKGLYPLRGFYSTVLDRVLRYPRTYYNLFATIEAILYEHLLMGTIGEDINGNHNIVQFDGENAMLDLVRDLLNAPNVEATTNSNMSVDLSCYRAN